MKEKEGKDRIEVKEKRKRRHQGRIEGNEGKDRRSK